MENLQELQEMKQEYGWRIENTYLSYKDKRFLYSTRI